MLVLLVVLVVLVLEELVLVLVESEVVLEVGSRVVLGLTLLVEDVFSDESIERSVLVC